MVRLDLKYIREWSLLLDLKILLMTPKAVIGGNGAMNGSSKFFMAVTKEFELRGSGHLHIKKRESGSLLPDITPDLPEMDAKTARLVE